MHLRYLFLLLLLSASQADASALYKCSGPKKNAVSIQSAPCTGGSKQVWVRDGTPERPPTYAELRAREAKRRDDAQSARTLSGMAGTDTASNRYVYQNQARPNYSAQRCNSAKAQIKVIRDREWRTLTVERLRQLDACWKPNASPNRLNAFSII